MGWFDLEYKTEAIKTMIARGKVEDALEMADEVKWKRVKDAELLCIVSDLYRKNKQYDKSKELLLLADKRQPGDTEILYLLCDVCIKMDHVAEAGDYYEEYIRLSSETDRCLMLKYKLAVATDKSTEEKIEILEELKNEKNHAAWRFELARLYRTAKQTDKCKAECDEIIEQFGGSKIAARAQELKNKLG